MFSYKGIYRYEKYLEIKFDLNVNYAVQR